MTDDRCINYRKSVIDDIVTSDIHTDSFQSSVTGHQTINDN